MKQYQKMYYGLFNAITDALEAIAVCNYGVATERLKQAQIEAERHFIAEKAEFGADGGRGGEYSKKFEKNEKNS